MIVSQLQKFCNRVETDKVRLRLGIIVLLCAINHGSRENGTFPVGTAMMYFTATAAEHVFMYYTRHQIKDIVWSLDAVGIESTIKRAN